MKFKAVYLVGLGLILGLVFKAHFMGSFLSLFNKAFFEKGDELVFEVPLKETNLLKPRKSKENLATLVQIQKDITFCGFDSKSKILNDGRTIIFNEIAWMGDLNGSEKEWIEVKNTSSKVLDVSLWQVLDKDEQIKIIFPKNTKIQPNELHLLKRSTGSIKEDFTSIYEGNLKNSDEGLRLFDSNCNLVDEVLASPNWPAGENESKRTMERASDFSWHTSENIGGTPLKENSAPLGLEVKNSEPLVISSVASTSLTVEAPETANPNEQNNPSPANQNNPQENTDYKVFVSEIFYDAEGGDVGKEFIELYNAGSNDVNLENWSLVMNGSSLVKFGSKPSDKKLIKSNGYFLIGFNNYVGSLVADVVRSTSLLNTSASISLLDKEGRIKDLVSYNNSVSSGESWERISTDDNQFKIQTSPNPRNSSY